MIDESPLSAEGSRFCLKGHCYAKDEISAQSGKKRSHGMPKDETIIKFLENYSSLQLGGSPWPSYNQKEHDRRPIDWDTLFPRRRPDTVRELRSPITTEGGSVAKGLIITTSRFTKGAEEEAKKANPIDLMDGLQLAEKMRELGLGGEETFAVRPDWFKQFEETSVSLQDT